MLSLDEAKHHQVVNGRTTTTVNRGSFDLQEVEGMLRKHEGELDKLEGQLESELLKRQREVLDCIDKHQVAEQPQRFSRAKLIIAAGGTSEERDRTAAG